MMRLVVLGSGGSMPTKDTLPAGFAFKYGGVYLFDCPEAAQVQLLRCGVGFGVDAIFLSHLHADHFLGLFGLVQSMGLLGRKEELKIFGPKGTNEFLSKIFSLPHLRPVFPIAIKDVSSGVFFKTPLFSVKAFAVKHNCPALGYALQEPSKWNFDEKKAKLLGVRGKLFSDLLARGKVKIGRKTVKLEDVACERQGKKIVFTGDSLPCREIVKNAENADLLVHDSCFASAEEGAAKEKFHSTSRQAAQTASKAKVKKLLLSHVSNRYEDRSVVLREAKEVFPDSVMAKEGMELFI
ncbi:MAG: ribonuclease Z [Candidatus Norongarragalinales archaeon]